VPILVILNIVFALAMGIHAVRTDRTMPWLLIILLVPFLGSLIYFITQVVPELRHSRAARQVGTGLQDTIDPDRDYRMRLREVKEVGSADAKAGLARECLKRGMAEEAIRLYREAATGAHRDDAVLLSGLAEAQFHAGSYGEVVRTLDHLRSTNPDLNAPDAHLLYARALEAGGNTERAWEEYHALAGYYPGEEAKVRYALFLQKQGEVDQARKLFTAVVDGVNGASKRYFRAQKDWYDVARRNLGDRD